jgi:hypothetical protein
MPQLYRHTNREGSYLKVRRVLKAVRASINKVIAQCIWFHTYEPTEYKEVEIEMKNIRKC